MNLALRRVLIIRPQVLIVEDIVHLTRPETGVQSWNSLFPFQREGKENAFINTEKGLLQISLLEPSEAPRHITEDSVHRDISQEPVRIVPVHRTAFTAPPALNHRFLTVITLTPKDGKTDTPEIHTKDENAEFLVITQGDQITRIARHPDFRDRLSGVDSDGSTVFATYVSGTVVEAGAFNATFLRSGGDVIEGDGFLSNPR